MKSSVGTGRLTWPDRIAGSKKRFALGDGADALDAADARAELPMVGKHWPKARLDYVQSHENLCMLLHDSSSWVDDRPAPERAASRLAEMGFAASLDEGTS